MQQPGEPSVEDILESIKLVIARDNRAAGSAGPRVTRPASVAHDPAKFDPRMPAPAAPAPAEDVLDLDDAARYVDPVSARGADGEDDEDGAYDTSGLVTPQARAAMRESLAALSLMAEPGARPRIVRSGETSLDDMARELLRPALAAWLDAHLPAMVEKMVAAEIARIVGKKV